MSNFNVSRNRSQSVPDLQQAKAAPPLEKQKSLSDLKAVESSPTGNPAAFSRQRAATLPGSPQEQANTQSLGRSRSASQINSNHLKSQDAPSLAKLEAQLLPQESAKNSLIDKLKSAFNHLNRTLFSTPTYAPIAGIKRNPDQSLSFQNEVSKAFSARCDKEFNSENRDFLVDVQRFLSQDQVDIPELQRIYDTYIPSSAPAEININSKNRNQFKAAMSADPIDVSRAIDALQASTTDLFSESVLDVYARFTGEGDLAKAQATQNKMDFEELKPDMQALFSRGPVSALLGQDTEIAQGLYQFFEKEFTQENRDFLLGMREVYQQEAPSAGGLKHIYNKFISTNAAVYINIASPTREALEKIFGQDPLDIKAALGALNKATGEINALVKSDTMPRFKKTPAGQKLEQQLKLAADKVIFTNFKPQMAKALDKEPMKALFNSDPEIAQEFYKHFDKEYNAENRNFLMTIKEIFSQDTITIGTLKGVFDKFIATGSDQMLNISAAERTNLTEAFNENPVDLTRVLNGLDKSTQTVMAMAQSETLHRFKTTPAGQKFVAQQDHLQQVSEQKAADKATFDRFKPAMQETLNEEPLSVLFHEDADIAQGFYKFFDKEFSGENRDFMLTMRDLFQQESLTTGTLKGVYETFIAADASKALNLPGETQRNLTQVFSQNPIDLHAALAGLQDVSSKVNQMIKSDTLARFKSSEIGKRI